MPQNFQLEKTVDNSGKVLSGYEQKVQRNFSTLESKVNENINTINILNNLILPSEDQSVTIENIINVFENNSEQTIVFDDINYGSGTYAGFEYTIPQGMYIKSSSIPLINIEKIVDGDIFVKMRIEERDFISSLKNEFEDDISLFQLQINENNPLNETVKFTSGQTISISQIASQNDEPPTIRFDSTIPLEYYHINKYNIVPSQPDPSNPYRYKVYSGPYRRGSLRVYINTHRIPDEKLDQSFASSGEFRFVSNISTNELPDSSKNDFITCDFDIPFLLGPEDILDSELAGNWWGDLITHSDGGVLEADTAYKTLRFYPLSGSFSSLGSTQALQIRSSNPYGSTDSGIDTIYFVLDISQIDHSLLKNFNTSNYYHHKLNEDDQNIWKTIIDTSLNYINPSSTSSSLTLKSTDGSVSITSSPGVLDFQATGTGSAGASQSGVANVTNGVSSYSVTLPSPASSSTYSVLCNLQNTSGTYSHYLHTVTAKSANSFTLTFSSIIDNANYKLNWAIFE